MNGFDPCLSRPDSPCERRKLMLLRELKPTVHGKIGGKDVTELLEDGQHQLVIDLFFAHRVTHTPSEANNLACAYALSGDLERAWELLREAAHHRDGNKKVRDDALHNLLRVLLALEAGA